ncbi:DUF3109 family protein [Alistipes sp. OttesenSCG-928-B03]|nr:DUF3109 family protein [Alistipes sp. OttesenSCG-928-B03]
MIEIGNKIVSLDIFKECFCCDLGHCRGACCVEGNAGAPLEMDEVDTLEEEYAAYEGYMKPEGREAIEEQGFFVVDDDGDYTTTLIGDAECAYSYEQDGVTFCAIERAWLDGRTAFRKPVSCHLYPIRVARFSNGSYGLNYHRWDICSGAVANGRRIGMPVYKALREPLVRQFGEEFYAEMEGVADALREEGVI